MSGSSRNFTSSWKTVCAFDASNVLARSSLSNWINPSDAGIVFSALHEIIAKERIAVKGDSGAHKLRPFKTPMVETILGSFAVVEVCGLNPASRRTRQAGRPRYLFQFSLWSDDLVQSRDGQFHFF